MKHIRILLQPYKHLRNQDTKEYREWSGAILRADDTPLTEHDANF